MTSIPAKETRPLLCLLDLFVRLGLLDKGRGARDLLEEDVALDEPRKPHGALVVDEFPCRNGKDLCRFVSGFAG
jgi:hypothetical protein